MSDSEQESQGPVIRDRRRIDPVTGEPRQPAESAGQADAAPAGQAQRGSGQSRPGKHAVSKPGSPRPEAAGADPVAGSGEAGGDQGESDEAKAPEAGAPSQGATSSDAPTTQRTGGADVAAMLAERTADLQRVQAEYANYRKRVERDRVAVREQALASVVNELLPVLDDIGRAREHEELTGGFKAVADALESAAAKLGLTTFGEAGDPFDPNVHEALMHSYSADVTEPTCVQILQPGYKVGERILRPARVAVAEPGEPAGTETAGQADSQEAAKPADAAQAADGEAVPPESSEGE
jgi:molecular chaperone GrpE